MLQNQTRSDPLYIIDVAHPPRHPDEVEEALVQARAHVRNSPVLRVLKIIHGYGSHGKGGSTRECVRNWVFRHRREFKRIIDGEYYTLHDAGTAEIRREVGPYEDPDLNAANPGVTVLWIK